MVVPVALPDTVMLPTRANRWATAGSSAIARLIACTAEVVRSSDEPRGKETCT